MITSLFIAAAMSVTTTGSELTAARHVIDATFEAAEACDYALRYTKQYSDCDMYYDLAIRDSGHPMLMVEIKQATKATGNRSKVMEALLVINEYSRELASNNEQDPDFAQWHTTLTGKFIGIFRLDQLFFQARQGQLYVPAN